MFRTKSYASALALSPDGLLTITQRELGRVILVNPHGDVSVLEEACEVADALRVSDADGRSYVAAGDAVVIIDDDGDRIGELRLPEEPRALALGGGHLYVASETGVLRLPLAAEGAS